MKNAYRTLFCTEKMDMNLEALINRNRGGKPVVGGASGS